MKSNLTLICGLALVFAFGCDKKSTPVRAKGGAQKTAGGVAADPAATQRAQQQAAANGLDVSITDVYYPEQDQNSDDMLVATDISVKTPQSQSLPVTTRHSYMGSNSFGQVTIGTGLTLKVTSRCEGEACNAYYMLASLEQNGNVVAQSVTLSFDCDEHFYRDSVPRERFMKSISDVQSFYSGKTETNNCGDGGANGDDPFTLGGF